MGDTMEYIALTGISDNVMRELRNHVLRTIEIRSPNNFLAALHLNAGDYVFLTHTSAQDLTGGNIGVIARVQKHQIATHKLVHSNEMLYEECEMTMARIQLEPKCTARIRKIGGNVIGEITRVDAEQISCYEAW